MTGRGQILTILQANSYSIGQKSGEIWTGQTLLQPISFKSDRLLGRGMGDTAARVRLMFYPDPAQRMLFLFAWKKVHGHLSGLNIFGAAPLAYVLISMTRMEHE